LHNHPVIAKDPAIVFQKTHDCGLARPGMTHKENAFPIENHTCGMEIACVPGGQNAGEEDFIAGK
jgi:hypothetical protein